MSITMSAKKEETRVPGIATFYFGLAVDIVLLYVINNLVYFKIPFLTDQLVSCLWAINLALGMGIIGNFVLLLYRPAWFYHLVQAISNLLVILAFYIVLRVFPFNFSQGILQTSVKVTLIVVMAGIGIASLIELIRFGLALLRKKTPPLPPDTRTEPDPPAQ